MKPRRFLLCLLLVSFFGFAADASARVRWRVSIKIFTDDNGNRPSGTTDTAMQTRIADYTLRLQAFARGLEMELTEIVELDPSLSNWFNRAARDSANRQELQDVATLVPSLYAYRDNSIHVYSNNPASGICCGAGNGLVFMGNPNATSSTMFHEIGHFMG